MFIPVAPLPSPRIVLKSAKWLHTNFLNLPWLIPEHDDLAAFPRGAYALASLAKTVAKNAVFFFPSYYCNDSLAPLRATGAELVFYRVRENMCPDWDDVFSRAKVKKPDILIVVDFGFLIPSWLLDLPKIAPLNIHPSLLPRWRGSTPGPSVLLHGDKKSAVTLMIMNEKMDEGPILSQIPFTVDPTWTQTEYYQTSFDLICEKLGDHIEQFLQKKIIPSIQPTKSPTPTALKLTKEKAFISWNEIKNAMQNGEKATEIERASRAFYPWPKLWTKVITNKGKKRFIIHSCFIDEKKHLQLDKVQLEGKSINNWSEIKNSVLE